MKTCRGKACKPTPESYIMGGMAEHPLLRRERRRKGDKGFQEAKSLNGRFVGAHSSTGTRAGCSSCSNKETTANML
jgi:hypothetical protein